MSVPGPSRVDIPPKKTMVYPNKWRGVSRMGLRLCLDVHSPGDAGIWRALLITYSPPVFSFRAKTSSIWPAFHMIATRGVRLPPTRQC